MKTRHFSRLPKAYTAIPKVLQSLINKPKSSKKILPQVEYILDELIIDKAHLAKYNQVCHFENGATVPAIYLAVLAQSLQMQMMTNEPFPFPLLGLVHIRNQITQFRAVHVDDVIELSCKFGELQAHDKGLQFDFIISAKVAGKVVVEGLTTYLARQKTTTSESSKAKKELTLPEYNLQHTWTLLENTGRRYAPISGDFNLIHIHALTAKAFGFKQAIAHGMWSKARSLAALAPLPDAYSVDVWFKLPIFLPSEVEFLTDASPSKTEFLVRQAKSHKPHLSGVLTVPGV